MTEGSRVIFCPSCSARYTADANLLMDVPLVVLCGLCGTASRVGGEAPKARADEEVHAPVRAAETHEGDALADALLPRVVVGHEVPAAARSLAQVLRNAGYAPVCVRLGEQVLQACDPAMPAPPEAVVLDVGIPGIMAFEVIEQLRAQPNTSGLPIILLASVFERTRYKRRPNRLYGADAYVELHHVPDRLPSILTSLRDKQPISPERVQAPAERALAAALRAQTSTAGHDGVAALARRLLSDVALYHGDEVADGVKRGAPFMHLGSAIEDARRLFREGVGLRADADTFDVELDAFVGRLLERGRGTRPDG
jgi:CheY-like chemotaxis protein